MTVRHQLSELQLQAFAAPKRSGLWDEVRGEIATEIGGTSGQSAEREGPFGTELVAHVPAEQGQPASGMRPIRFVGVDGPRWFLRGLFARAAAANPAAVAPFQPRPARSSSSAASTRCRRATCLSQLPAEAAAALEEQTRAQQAEQAEEQQNRFATAPNPFQRGPEMTETRESSGGRPPHPLRKVAGLRPPREDAAKSAAPRAVAGVSAKLAGLRGCQGVPVRAKAATCKGIQAKSRWPFPARPAPPAGRQRRCRAGGRASAVSPSQTRASAVLSGFPLPPPPPNGARPCP